MNAIASLTASAQAFEAIGEHHAAEMCRQMAEDCKSAGILGEPLYRNWASQMAERATVRCQKFHNSSHRDRSVSPKSGSGVIEGEAA